MNIMTRIFYSIMMKRKLLILNQFINYSPHIADLQLYSLKPYLH